MPDGIPVYGYGAMLFIAVLVCTWLASRLAKREGIRPQVIQDLAFWFFAGGIIGARLTFLITEHEPFWTFFRIWDGGLVLYGAIIGALIAYIPAYFFLIRKHQIATLRLGDLIAPSVAIGICLGRIGCLLNGCCFGNVACPDCYQMHFPLASPPRFSLAHFGYQTAAGFTLSESAIDDRTVDVVDPQSPAAASGLKPGDVIVQASAVPVVSADDERMIASFMDLYDFMEQRWPRGKNQLLLHVKRGNEELAIGPFAPQTIGLYPTQLYESISMALLFLVLTAYFPLRRKPGEVMAILAFCYGISRWINEMLRNDPRPVGFEWTVSVALIAIGFTTWILLRASAWRTLFPAEPLGQTVKTD
jgi:phosphatidylglycerol:prolipoprotein diacylglycerol transferase